MSQSPALWCDTIDVALLGIGFTPTSSDLCVYTTYGSYDTCENSEDVLISGSNLGVVNRLKKALMDCFPMAKMDEISVILGVNKKLYEAGMSAFMPKDYIQSILERYGTLDCNSVHTP